MLCTEIYANIYIYVCVCVGGECEHFQPQRSASFARHFAAAVIKPKPLFHFA